MSPYFGHGVQGRERFEAREEEQGKRVKRWRENKEGGRDEEEVECRL